MSHGKRGALLTTRAEGKVIYLTWVPTQMRQKPQRAPRDASWARYWQWVAAGLRLRR